MAVGVILKCFLNKAKSPECFGAKRARSRSQTEGLSKCLKRFYRANVAQQNHSAQICRLQIRQKPKRWSTSSALFHELVILLLKINSTSLLCYSPQSVSLHWDQVIQLREEEHASEEAGANQRNLSALDISLAGKRVGSWKLFKKNDLFGGALRGHYWAVFGALALPLQW